MSIPLRTLIIEDSEDDTLLLVRILQKGGYDPAYKRVETADAMDEALERAVWDIIMCDYSMPHFNGHEALALFKKKELEIPFIVVSGTIGEEAAVAIMISGAHDYVMKTNLSRLVPAVQRELKETESRRKRKLAEEALKISEQKYRNIFENVVEGIFQTTPEGRFLIANSVQASILGYGSPEELIETVTDMGKQIYVNPDDREEYLRIIQESGLVKDFEVQLKKKDSSIIWASLNARSVFDENNKLLCCEGTIEDITSRKEAEIALQKSRDELAVIIEGSAIPQFVINQDHVVILWNKALEIYSGMDAKDVSGTSDHWKAFYPVKRPCLVDLVIDGANGDEFTRWYGTRYKKSIFIDGAYEATGYFTCMKGGIWLFFTAVTINDSSGNMIAAIETLEDITGLKTAETSMRQSEEKYRSIFENAIEGIFQATPEGRFISVNPAMAYMHGFASPEEMIMGVADIGQQLYVNPEDRARYRAILEEKELVNNFEAQIYRTDGNILWTSTNTRVVKDEAGHITCFEGTSEDITSRKLAEENLKVID